MMKTIRLAAALILAAAMLLSLSACSGTPEASKEAASSEASVPEASIPEISAPDASVSEASGPDASVSEEEASEPMAELSDELHAAIQQAAPSPEWVTKLDAAQNQETKQLFVVAGISMNTTTATISMHQRDENGQWMQLLSTPGYVGKNGLCLDEDHAEGCGQTPVGTYHFNKAFGIAADPGTVFDYIQVTDDTYWSGDAREGMHYNEMVDIKDFPDLDMTDSEHIVDYEYQYQYCLNISFNEDGTPGRGSAIFLHCLGPVKPWTGGCVAVPEYIMKLILQNVDPECVVVIDTAENLGVTF